MANWLERAKREIPRGADRATAKADEGNPTTLMAAPEPDGQGISRGSFGSNDSAPSEGFHETAPAVPMTAGEEVAIRAWLAHIEETDEAAIAAVLTQCRTDAEARAYFAGRAGEVPRFAAFDDDLRRCDQCANLTVRGLCLAARRGEIVAGRGYEPIRDLPRRCEGYAPGPNDPDRRPGRDRWPGLIEKGHDHANT